MGQTLVLIQHFEPVQQELAGRHAWAMPTASQRRPGPPCKVDPIVQTKSGAEIVKVVSGLTGAVASSEAAAPPRET